MALEKDEGIMDELDNIVDNGNTEKTTKSRKPKKANDKEQELNRWIVNTVDETISDGYIYSGAERQTQQAEAWRRYYRSPYGDEVEGYSDYVSPMIQTQVNQYRAFITEQYYRNSSPIVKFKPSDATDIADAERATEYVNYIFRNKLDGHSIIDQTVFNAALLKMCPVRIYEKETRKKEPIIFDYEGPSAEEAEDKLAAFIVANKVEDKEPYKIVEDEKDGMYYYCYEWASDEMVEKYPHIEVISPENFFISRQAESLESAKVVSKISNMRLSDLKEMFPEAPLLNGFGPKDFDRFWEELQSDYQTWYSETTWFAKWSNDSLQYFEQYDNQNDESAGLGTKELFVVDAEIYLDPDDSGEAKLCHIVKAGNNLLYKKEIDSRSFLCGSLFPTANRWLGISLWDILEPEAREETTLTRAFTDAAVQAAHPNIAFDPNVYEEDDVYNRGADTVIRARVGGIPQQGVSPLEVVKLPGPDASVQAAITHFKTQAAESTGVGAGFQGADSAEISDMRIDKETAKAIQNNSTLLLNYAAKNYANFLCKVLVKVLDVAIKGGSSKQLLQIQDDWNEIDPIGLKPRADFVLDVDIGVNESQDKLNKAQGIMTALGLLQGQPDPQTGQPLGITADLLPTAGYEVGKLILEAHGAKDMVHKILKDPEVEQDPQVQAAIQGAVQEVTAQFQQQMAQMQEEIRNQVMLELNTAEKQAEVEVKKREVAVKERKLDIEEDKAAYDLAVKDVAEERRDDAEAYKAASSDRANEISEKKIDKDYELKLREMELQEKLANKAAETKNSNVVSP